jgi:hypothetical protein
MLSRCGRRYRSTLQFYEREIRQISPFECVHYLTSLPRTWIERRNELHFLANRNVVSVVCGVELVGLREKQKESVLWRGTVAFNVVPV